MTSTTVLFRFLFMAATLTPGVALPDPVNAQSDEARVKRETHAVSRLYQLVYGGPEVCSRLGSADAQAAAAASARFRHAYPELMKLVDESPFVGIARERNRRMVDGEVAYAARNPQSEPDCRDG